MIELPSKKDLNTIAAGVGVLGGVAAVLGALRSGGLRRGSGLLGALLGLVGSAAWLGAALQEYDEGEAFAPFGS